MKNKGLIVIEGLDGSGKQTQSELLENKLKGLGKRIAFPNYESPSSSLVKMYLQGELGDSHEVNAYAASLLYAVDRFASFRKEYKKLGEEFILIADRYVQSNIIYQMTKLPKEEWNDYIKWEYKIEYGYLELPIPDLVIYLDVDVLVSQKLMDARYQNGGSKDIHEKNSKFLKDCRETALYLCSKEGWKVIKCSVEGRMRSVEEINNEIMMEVERWLNIV